jgi:four helix bundle protein
MGIALRRTSETEYWLRLLVGIGAIEEKDFATVDAHGLELKKLLTAIIKSGKGQK